jgi:hypothetical protein
MSAFYEQYEIYIYCLWVVGLSIPLVRLIQHPQLRAWTVELIVPKLFLLAYGYKSLIKYLTDYVSQDVKVWLLLVFWIIVAFAFDQAVHIWVHNPAKTIAERNKWYTRIFSWMGVGLLLMVGVISLLSTRTVAGIGLSLPLLLPALMEFLRYKERVHGELSNRPASVGS